LPIVHPVQHYPEERAEFLADLGADEVGPLYKLNPVVTHSLKAPGFNP
jgi:hypothetical protein